MFCSLIISLFDLTCRFCCKFLKLFLFFVFFPNKSLNAPQKKQARGLLYPAQLTRQAQAIICRTTQLFSVKAHFKK